MKLPSTQPLFVTDHAVLRYMERHYGFNMELIREHIREICAAPAAFGAVCVRAEGVRFEIERGRVITVTPDSATPNRTNQKLAQQRMRA